MGYIGGEKPTDPTVNFDPNFQRDIHGWRWASGGCVELWDESQSVAQKIRKHIAKKSHAPDISAGDFFGMVEWHF